MILILLVLIIEIIAFSFFYGYISEEQLLLGQLILINLHFLFTFFYIFISGNKFKTILLIGLAVRLLLLYVDYFNIFPVVHSGTDTELFHQFAQMTVEQNARFTYTHYLDFLVVIYRYLGPVRLLAQYLNVIMGLGIIMFINHLFTEMKIPNRIHTIAIVLLSLFPHFIIFSSLLLREAWIELSLTLSAICFVIWYKNNTICYFAFSILFVLLGAYMHSGVILTVFGYITGFILLDRKTKQIRLNVQTAVYSLMLVLVFVLISSQLSVFLDRFENLNTQNYGELMDFIGKESTGGSAYLTGINFNNPLMAILFFPLKVFYFFFSPVIFDWRGMGDIIGAAMNTSVFLFLFYKIMVQFHRNKDRYYANLTRFLLISVLAGSLVMAMGTRTSGVAMRHRTKFLPVLVIIYGITYKKYEKENLFCSC